MRCTISQGFGKMRCFIHVVTGERFLRDEDGADFPNLQAAAAEAAQSARDLMAEELRNGNVLPVSWKVLLSSPDDTVLMSLPFSQFVPAPEPLPHRARVAHRDYEGIERRHLGEADRHIMHGRARVGAQRERISRMEVTYAAADATSTDVSSSSRRSTLHSPAISGRDGARAAQWYRGGGPDGLRTVHLRHEWYGNETVNTIRFLAAHR